MVWKYCSNCLFLFAVFRKFCRVKLNYLIKMIIYEIMLIFFCLYFLQNSQSLGLNDDHIIIIMVIFTLILTGMCLTFIYNCVKKLIRDHHTIQVSISFFFYSKKKCVINQLVVRKNTVQWAIFHIIIYRYMYMYCVKR